MTTKHYNTSNTRKKKESFKNGQNRNLPDFVKVSLKEDYEIGQFVFLSKYIILKISLPVIVENGQNHNLPDFVKVSLKEDYENGQFVFLSKYKY